MKTVFLDTETTGLMPDDEVLELAIVDEDGHVLIDTLVRPVHRSEWPESQTIHGITPADVRTAPTLSSLQADLTRAVAGARVVIFNADFDRRFLDLSAAGEICCAALEWMWFAGFSPDPGGWTLADVAQAVGHDWAGHKPHRALADALATRTVWRHLKKL